LGAGLPNAFMEVISPGYFRTLQAPLLRGRDFMETDSADSPRVAIVNEAFTRRHWPGQAVLGKCFRCPTWGDQWITVVGIAPDMRMQGLYDRESAGNGFYLPLSQSASVGVTAFIRVSGDPLALANSQHESMGVTNPLIHIRIDPRLELLAIVQYLSGYREWQGLITDIDFPYRREIETHFSAYRDHAAVKYFDTLSVDGFSFDAPPTAMLYLSDPPELKQVLQAEVSQKFPYVEGLCRSLESYEKQREAYPGFVDYYPELIKVFAEFSARDLDTDFDSAPFKGTLLTPKQIKEDLDFTVKTLRNVHPATYRGFSKQQQAIIEAAYRQIQTPRPAKEFFFIANSVICSLQDGHTHLRSMQHTQGRRIDVPLIGLHNGFYVMDLREPFQPGDRIVAINQQSMESIYQRLRTLIPSENEHRRKWCMADTLQREEYLDYLTLIDSHAVTLCVDRGGTETTLVAPLKPADQCHISQSKRPWVGYQIDKPLSLGVFHLDTCNPNDRYKETVRTFFEEVSTNRIQNIAIDVRRNGGGNSRVVNLFLEYLNVDHYHHFGGDVRFSKEVVEKTHQTRSSGYRHGKPKRITNRKVKDANLVFDGDLFVLTSPQTFSSGNWFAVIVKDNALGTVIGEPTGNAPLSYGDVPSFRMPNTRFEFTVSYKRWIRPNPDNDPEDALYPDILVYTTIEDIIKGNDPQLEKLKSIIEEKSP
jgi:C-terminal processing protease CtpA/Prc